MFWPKITCACGGCHNISICSLLLKKVWPSLLCAIVVDMSLFRSDSELLLLLLRSQVCIFSSWFWTCEECTLADVCTCIATSNMLQSISTLDLKMTNAVDVMQVHYQLVLATNFWNRHTHTKCSYSILY